MKDSRYTLTREFTGLSHKMYVFRFCGDFVAAYKHKADALEAMQGHFERRLESLTGKKLESITGHRNPTPYEIRYGYGATHYRDFEPSVWLSPFGYIKNWILADDGLRYYR